MTVTSDACRKVASQLAKAQKMAAFGGPETGVRVKDPGYLIRLLRRSARELDRP